MGREVEVGGLEVETIWFWKAGRTASFHTLSGSSVLGFSFHQIAPKGRSYPIKGNLGAISTEDRLWDG